MTIGVRTQVFNAINHELQGEETLSEVVEDLAYLEASARKRFAGSSEDSGSPIDCTMTEPQITITVTDRPLQLLHESVRPGESLDGLVTALIIAEVRYRRTGMHWPVFSAAEPVMTDDATIIDGLIHHHETTITTTSGGHLMYTICIETREDVLDAFDGTLDDWEDRSEELAALIHLEDECRDAQWSMVCADPDAAHPRASSMVTLDIDLDEHDHAALERLLRTGEDAGELVTGLMLSSLASHPQGAVRASDPMPA